MSTIRALSLAPAALALVGCASAVQDPERFQLSAPAAHIEAHTQALGWSSDATLRYVEGRDLTPAGTVLPGEGGWLFVYDSPSRSAQLVVSVTPRTVMQAERDPQSPPGMVLGDRALPAGWVSSVEVMDRIRSRDGEPAGPIEMLLVPLDPPQWRVRAADGSRWTVDARTGEMLP